MAINLSALNAQQQKKAEEAKAARYSDPFLMYEDKKANKEKFEVMFDSADTEGNLYIRKDGVDLCLPIEELQTTDRYYNPQLRGNYIGIKTLEVMVSRVDRENRIVYLKSGRVTENIVKQITQQLDRYNNNVYWWNTIEKELRAKGKKLEDEETLKQVNAERTKKGYVPIYKPEQLEVYGTIVAMDETREHAYVKIYGQPIQGIISCRNWTTDRIKYFSEDFVDSHPDPIRFDLVGRTRHNNRKFYNLSTRRFENNIWNELPKPLIEKKGVVVALCTAIDDKCWWAHVDGVPVPLYAKFTEKFEVRVGHKYTCTVHKSDSANHSIVLTPFKYIRKEGETQVRGVSDSGAIVSEDILNKAIEIALSEQSQIAAEEINQSVNIKDTERIKLEGLGGEV